MFETPWRYEPDEDWDGTSFKVYDVNNSFLFEIEFDIENGEFLAHFIVTLANSFGMTPERYESIKVVHDALVALTGKK